MKDTKNKPDKITLRDAYSIETTEDSLKLYDKWAETYDDEFAKAVDYRTPDLIAGMYAERCADKSAPMLDIGAGTGLVAEGLVKRGVTTIDALDISEKMLEVAARKQLYRTMIVADLNKPMGIAPGSYAGFTSTGTFTHGHVGPDALDQLVEIGRPGALYVLGIKAAIFESAGFAARFKALAPLLADFEIIEKAGYGDMASKDLQASTTAVAVFRKA